MCIGTSVKNEHQIILQYIKIGVKNHLAGFICPIKTIPWNGFSSGNKSIETNTL